MVVFGSTVSKSSLEMHRFKELEIISSPTKRLSAGIWQTPPSVSASAEGGGGLCSSGQRRLSPRAGGEDHQTMEVTPGGSWRVNCSVNVSPPWVPWGKDPTFLPAQNVDGVTVKPRQPDWPACLRSSQPVQLLSVKTQRLKSSLAIMAYSLPAAPASRRSQAAGLEPSLTPSRSVTLGKSLSLSGPSFPPFWELEIVIVSGLWGFFILRGIN